MYVGIRGYIHEKHSHSFDAGCFAHAVRCCCIITVGEKRKIRKKREGKGPSKGVCMVNVYKYLLRRGWYWQCVCTSIKLFRVWCGFQFNLHRFYRSQTVFLNQKEASSRNIPSFYHRGIFQVKESKLKNGKSLEFKKKEKKKLKNECENAKKTENVKTLITARNLHL